MFSASHLKLIQGALILAVFGGYSASAFTPTCQSARFATQQHPLIRELRPAPLCSQLPMTRKPTPQPLALFRRAQQDGNQRNNNPLLRLRNLLQFRAWFTAISRVHSNIKRAVMILAASAMLWLGTAGSYTPPASASSNVMERVMPASNEQLIDRYVKRHMFDDDDGQDPLEAAYREAFEDYKTTGEHPRALKEVATEALGQGAGNKLLRSEDESSMGIFGVIKGAMNFLERRGLSEATAFALVGGTVVVVAPASMLLFGMIVGGISKRNMNALMKKRYGDTYTLDATVKEEPDVEAPDDDDDDDDDDDED